MYRKTIAELNQALKTKKISSVELTQHYLDRIKNIDPKLNCFISVTEAFSLNQAKAADKRLANGNTNCAKRYFLYEKY